MHWKMKTPLLPDLNNLEKSANEKGIKGCGIWQSNLIRLPCYCPVLADCKDSATKARRKAKEQQSLADGIAKRVEENEEPAKTAWGMALEVAQKVVEQWLEAAEAWETAVELYEKIQDAE